jgi:diaminopimelate epimerase
MQFVKYEAVGNDFLVLFDGQLDAPFSSELVAALCDRHRGVGADGVLRLSDGHGGATVTMALKNADGTDAETSGNGLRCAALAVVQAGLGTDEFVIDTIAGPARCVVHLVESGRAEVTVEMGEAKVQPVGAPIEGRAAYRVEVGNPHLVLVGSSLDGVDLERVGPRLEKAVPGGQNVEVVAAGEDPHRIALRVWERGAGLTEACGSGSVAAAAACRFAGLASSRVVVNNPGGALTVELSGADLARPLATLTGPARRVARVEVELGALLSELGR